MRPSRQYKAEPLPLAAPCAGRAFRAKKAEPLPLAAPYAGLTFRVKKVGSARRRMRHAALPPI